jgi:hypothetical protein
MNSSQSQKSLITTTIAGRYQLNRFDVLMRALANDHSYFAKAMKSTGDQTANYAQRQKELNQVLRSHPQQLKQIMVMLQNMAAEIIGPLIPLIISMANGIKVAVQWFTNLDPRIQRLSMLFLLLLATMGPIIRYLGSIALMVSFLGKTVVELGKFILLPFRLLGGAAMGAASLVGKAFLGMLVPMRAVVAYLLDTVLVVFGTTTGAIARAFSAAFAAIGRFIIADSAALAAIVTRSIGALLAPMLGAVALFARSILMGTLVPVIRMAVLNSLIFLNLLWARGAQILAGFGATVAVFARNVGASILLAGSTIFTGIVTSLGTALAFMTRTAGLWLASFGALFARGLTAIQLFFAAFWTNLIRIVDVIGLALSRAVNAVLGAIELAWAATSAAITLLWSRTMTFVALATSGIGSVILRAWTMLGAGIVTVWRLVSSGVVALWTRTLTWLAGGGLLRMVLTGWSALGRGMLAITAAIRSGVFKLLVSPWSLAVLAIIAVVSAFRDRIGQIWHNIVQGARGAVDGIAGAFHPIVAFFDSMIKHLVNAFNSLPQGVQNALLAVVHVVQSAAKQVYELFSYLNPFAHHSPSLVENVTGGMKSVRDQHAATSKNAQDHTKKVAAAHSQVAGHITRTAKVASSAQQAGGGASAGVNASVMSISSVDSTINRAIADVNKFKAASKGLIPNEWADQLKAVKQEFPQLLGMFNKLIGEYNKLNAVAARQQAAVDSQQKVVDRWKARLDAANDTLEKQGNKLDDLQKQLQGTQAAYDAAQSKMQDFASAPIKGMQAFTDKIFDNGIAQKKVQLQMDLWEQQNGSIDDLTNKFGKLNGTIEMLTGQAHELQQSGAGSDILGPINAEIAALQAQADATQTTIQNAPINDLQKQLDQLQRQGDILQLQNDIKFDPLEHQIEKLSNTTKELSYDQIIKGIKDARATMDKLTPTLDKQTAAVDAQQKVVDQATAARDRLQRRYDAEDKKLQRLQDRYQKTADAINKVKDALDSVGSAASQASSAAGKGTALDKQFAAAGAGNFPEPGGKANLTREGGLGDINKFIADEQKKLGDSLGNMDLFGPLKDMWKKAWAWIQQYVTPILHDIGHIITLTFQAIGNGIADLQKHGSGAGNFFRKTFGFIGSLFRGIINVVKLFWPEMKKVFDILGMVFKEIWNHLRPALTNLWQALKPLVEGVLLVLIMRLKVWASTMLGILGPALKYGIRILSNVINVIADVIKVFEDVFTIIKDIFTGKWGKLWGDVKKLFGDAWGAIEQTFMAVWNTIKGVFFIIVGAVKGFVNGIVGFFKWLYNILVGHSIVPDLMKAIVGWFQWIIKPIVAVMDLVWKGIKAAWDLITTVFKTAWNWVKNTFVGLWNGAKAIVTSPIEAARDLVSTAWGKIKGFFSTTWGWVRDTFKSLWNGAKAIVTSPIDLAKNTLSTVFGKIKGFFQDIWAWVRDTFSKVWSKVTDFFTAPIHAAKSVIDTVLGKIKSAFSTFKDALGPIWDKLEGILKAPIYFFTHTVYHQGLENIWNKIVGAIGLGSLKLPDPPKGWATGGVIPGYQPGKDTVPAMLSKGEGILRPEVVRDLGAGTIHRWNKNRGADGMAHFADGGVVGDISGFISSLGSALNPMKAYNWVKDKFGKVVGQMDKFGSTDFGKLITGVPKKLVGGMLSKIKDVFVNLAESDTAGVSGTYYTKLPQRVIDDFEFFMGDQTGKTVQGVEFVFQELLGLLRGLRVTGSDGGLSNGLREGLGLTKKNPAFVDNQWGYVTGGTGKEHWVRATAPGLSSRDPSKVRSATLARLSQMGWSAADVQALGHLWDGESGWRWNALNSSSGAYGIPQSLPANKMASAGSDWHENPQTQINWGLGYIRGRYGSASNAYNTWLSRDPHWYANGTHNSTGGWSWVGENGPELLNVRRGSQVVQNSSAVRLVADIAGRVAARIAAPPRDTVAGTANGPVTNNTTNNREEHYHFEGSNLVFPNVKTGEDADEFLKNFKRAVGGK